METVVMVCIFLLVPLLILMGNKQTKKLNEEKENDDKFIKETVGNYDNCKTYSYRDILKEISRYCIDIKDNKLYIFNRVDDNAKMILLKKRNINDITKCELLFDNETVHSTNRGSQALGVVIGGVALGGVGAVVGGLTGSKTAKKGKLIKSTIVIYYNTPEDPMDTLIFKKNNKEPQNDIEKTSSEFYATILACMESNNSKSAISKDTRLCPFCAEEIKKAAIVCKHCGRDIPQESIS